jgi:hypothetical protein
VQSMVKTWARRRGCRGSASRQGAALEVVQADTVLGLAVVVLDPLPGADRLIGFVWPFGQQPAGGHRTGWPGTMTSAALRRGAPPHRLVH